MPVVVATPAPVRMNQSSRVNVGRAQRRRRPERHAIVDPVELQHELRRGERARPPRQELNKTESGQNQRVLGGASHCALLTGS